MQLANVSFIKGADAHVDLTDDKAVQVSPCAVAGESAANRAFQCDGPSLPVRCS